MATRYTATALRADLYNVLDTVLATGQPVEIERNGRLVRIAPADEASRLSRLVRRACVRGDVESIVHMDWSALWKPEP